MDSPATAALYETPSDKARRFMRNDGVPLCFNCTRPGHRHQQCPFKKLGNSSSGDWSAPLTTTEETPTEKARRFINKEGVTICFTCSRPGHKHKECPQRYTSSDRSHQTSPEDTLPPSPGLTFGDFMRGKDPSTMPMEEFERCWEEYKARVKKNECQREEPDDPDHEVNQFVHKTLRLPSKNAQVLREVMRSQGYDAMLQIARVLHSVNQGRRHTNPPQKRELNEEEERVRWMEAELERPDVYAEVPSEMILIRNLPPTTTEQEIEREIERYSLKARDIRFMKNKKCPTRGFAFVEFATIAEAVRWKELTKGHLETGGMKALLKFCFPLLDNITYPEAIKSEWTCQRCNVTNFKWRTVCFICNNPPADSTCDREFEASLEVSENPTTTLLLRNLDSLTTEGKVQEALRKLCPQVKPLGFKIPVDSQLKVSKEYCLVELPSVKEAAQIMVKITASKLELDGRKAQ